MGSTPLSVYLPFNRDCLRGGFVPAKQAGTLPDRCGHWLIVQDQNLVVRREGEAFRLPVGECPREFDGKLGDPLWLGTLHGEPCWVATLPKDAPMPEGFLSETLVPMRGTNLDDGLLSIGGMAMQAIYWQSTSGFCPRCGAPTTRIEGEWGKKCSQCRYEHYPHLHPAVITLIVDGDRCLLARKREWAPGRYALIAGFVDNGECLEGCVEREVKEEVGVDVKDIRYVGSQNWPFPSQLMVGFVATYASGDVKVDTEELEEARWFPRNALPNRPSRHSIAGYILQHHAPV